MKKYVIKKLNGLISRLGGSATKKGIRRRAYSAAQISRLFHGWATNTVNINYDLRQAIRPIRARSQDLVKNNVYARKFLHMVGTNIVGPRGVKFQSKVRNAGGKLDVNTNKKIEAGWKRWGKKKYASANKSLSWLDIQHIFIKSVARDGECLLRKIKDPKRTFGLTLQFIDVDFLDEQYNKKLPNGNDIVLGIEFDEWEKPVAYHLKKKRGIGAGPYFGNYERERVPAEQIIHGFRPEHPHQARDVSWIATGVTDVKLLDGYKEAAVVGARIGASKMGFIFTPSGTEYEGDAVEEDGDIITEVEPGSIEQLPKGWDFKSFDPKQPSGEMEPFLRSNIQGLASGWNVSYISLANDQKGISYSTDRSSRVEERDNWMVLQEWFVETLCEEIFEAWLEMALLSGDLDIPFSKLEKLKSYKFQPKRWKWIDPLKDQKANETALKNKTTSRTRIAQEQGDDIEDIIEELAWEETEFKKRGLTIEEAEIIPKKPKPAKAATETEEAEQ